MQMTLFLFLVLFFSFFFVAVKDCLEGFRDEDSIFLFVGDLLDERHVEVVRPNIMEK